MNLQLLHFVVIWYHQIGSSKIGNNVLALMGSKNERGYLMENQMLYS